MQKLIVSIRDTVSEDSGPLLCVRTEAEAIRFFHGLVHGGDASISEHPDDYVLEHLGNMDTHSREREWTPERVLALGSDVKEKQLNPIRELEAPLETQDPEQIGNVIAKVLNAKVN